MTTKSRKYIRELSSEQLRNLKERYGSHIKPVRRGFLNPDDKKLLLQISRWGSKTQDQEVYDFFYNVRERAKSALLDLELISDVLNEEQLRTIFTAREYGYPEGTVGDYPIVRVLKSLIPSAMTSIKGYKPELAKEKEWRKYFLAEIVGMILMWYYYSGIFQTNSHKSVILNTLDAIEIMSTGTQRYSKSIKEIDKKLED